MSDGFQEAMNRQGQFISPSEVKKLKQRIAELEQKLMAWSDWSAMEDMPKDKQIEELKRLAKQYLSDHSNESERELWEAIGGGKEVNDESA